MEKSKKPKKPQIFSRALKASLKVKSKPPSVAAKAKRKMDMAVTK
jgi:hypothetical protein